MGVYLRVAGLTDIGRVRPKNEDAFIVADLSSEEPVMGPRWTGRVEVGAAGALVAVSDGLGGAQAGEVASALTLESLARTLATGAGNAPSQARITGAVEDAHRSVWVEASRRGIKMGATLTALYVRGVAAYVAEVGDSRAYLVRAGQITQLTKDQSYVQMLVDRGAIEPEQAQEMPLRNVIMQAIGNQPSVSVALGRLDLRRRDCILLCSDGLTTQLSDEEIRGVILGSPDLPGAADQLVRLANERGGRDNTTVALVGVGGDLPMPTRREDVGRTYQVLESFEG